MEATIPKGMNKVLCESSRRGARSRRKGLAHTTASGRTGTAERVPAGFTSLALPPQHRADTVQLSGRGVRRGHLTRREERGSGAAPRVPEPLRAPPGRTPPCARPPVLGQPLQPPLREGRAAQKTTLSLPASSPGNGLCNDHSVEGRQFQGNELLRSSNWIEELLQ